MMVMSMIVGMGMIVWNGCCAHKGLKSDFRNRYVKRKGLVGDKRGDFSRVQGLHSVKGKRVVEGEIHLGRAIHDLNGF